MKKIIIVLILLLFIVFPFNFIFAENLTPLITSYNPSFISSTYSNGSFGEVDIIGSGFGEKVISNGFASDGSVVCVAPYHMDWCQTIVKWNDTDVKVIVDHLQNYGDQALVVSSKDQSGNWVDSNSFTLSMSPSNGLIPHIDSITPTSIHVGDQIEITGKDFGNNPPVINCPAPPGYAAVPCGLVDNENRSQKIVSWSNTKIQAIIDNISTGVHIPLVLRMHASILNNDPTTFSNTKYIDILSSLPSCSSDTWSCSDWNTCSVNGLQSRSCIKTFDCSTANTPSPTTWQSCTPLLATPQVPACSEDIWSCSDWNSCSPSGLQSRSCKKTFDCSLVENAAPSTSRSCSSSAVAPSTNNVGNAETSLDYDQIFKSTVKLLCPMPDRKTAKQGSGTVIDQYGTVLTNRHVVQGTIGSCYVGFITSEDDIPTYAEIADTKNVSSDVSANGDMALLKIRNSGTKSFSAIDVWKGNSDSLKASDTILPFGYPNQDDFGETITSTEGPYSGKGTTIKLDGTTFNVGGFFKTTATIDHGNSGGAAYQKKTGYYMGIPTLGVNKVNYILSVNTIKKWLMSLGGSYGVTKNNFSNLNNYYASQVPIEDLQLSNLTVVDSSIDTSNGATSKTNVQDTTPQSNNNFSTLSGRILLQVESHGEAWYVNPNDGKRYYLKDGNVAYQAMRKFGLGIKNSDFGKVPKLGEQNRNASFVNSLKGKILLQTESHGEAWYVDPKDGFKYYMKDGQAAYSLMRNHSLGISNKDLEKIPVGSL